MTPGLPVARRDLCHRLEPLAPQEGLGLLCRVRAALRILPGMRDALFSLGWTYGLVDNRVEARRFLQKFVEVAGADAPAHYTKAARDRLAELGGG